MVPAPDAEVLDVAATTTDDLQQLAPHVPDKVRAAVEGADPSLDADLAAWAASTRPHLRLLGPIQARTGTTGKPTAVAKRKAFYTELLAFLALKPRLDLAAVVGAEGDRQAAERMLRDDVSNRADDGDAPMTYLSEPPSSSPARRGYRRDASPERASI